MARILGTVSSSMQKAASSFESIASATPTSSETITFSSIPSTYQHLQVRISGIINNGGSAIIMRFNSDTGSNYTWHSLAAQNASVFAGASTNTSFINCTDSFNGSVATYPNVSITDIHDYASTTKNKTTRTFFGADNNTTNLGIIGLMSGVWRSTSAITSIDVIAFSGNAFTTGSTIALYGIRG